MIVAVRVKTCFDGVGGGVIVSVKVISSVTVTVPDGGCFDHDGILVIVLVHFASLELTLLLAGGE